jgi:6-pyruvoyltetrahydropterin/6-carboxytetrahydropterin synthase
MNERLYLVAAAPFEAARRVDILPAGHRARRLHGHGFLARVRAELPPDWAPFPGAETDELAERLREAVAPLDYALLNDRLPTPTDENLARWLRARLAVPGLERIGIQSTRDQGVDLDGESTLTSGGGSASRRPTNSPTSRPAIPAGGCTATVSR